MKYLSSIVAVAVLMAAVYYLGARHERSRAREAAAEAINKAEEIADDVQDLNDDELGESLRRVLRPSVQ